MKNIYIVGFMATGKTAVGKALAGSLNRNFLDLDDLIEEKEGMRIVDIFSQKGEAYFRKLEKSTVKEVAARSDMVVACGGGAVVDTDNLNTLKASGVMVCLKADIDTILKRSKGTEHRPLLNVENTRERIDELFKKREPFYNQSDYIIDTTDLEIKEVVAKIVNVIDK